MKVVHINNVDLAGSRFNGYDLQIKLNKMGIPAKQLVYEKFSQDPNVVSFGEPVFTGNKQTYMNFEQRFSIHGLIYPYGRKIMHMKEFQDADVVHYHLIHNYIISLFDFVKMTAIKPAIWTIHDPWAFTGHCVYPIECTKWRTGCHDCGELSRLFVMKEDHASQMWKVKQAQYARMNLDIVVASKWMLKLLQESPLTAHFTRVHHIPFGVNLTLFKDQGTQISDRQELKIPPHDFVIAFRSDENSFKGLDYIKDMLAKLRPSRAVTLLTVGKKGMLTKFRMKYTIRECEWVTDEKKMAQIYSAADLFLMPSIAEAFGLMAIEAMAASRPVIVFEGTSLPDVTYAPECGISLPRGDTAFVSTVERLINHPEECRRRGQLGRQLAEEHYDEEVYFSRLLKLYQEVATRGKTL